MHRELLNDTVHKINSNDNKPLDTLITEKAGTIQDEYGNLYYQMGFVKHENQFTKFNSITNSNPIIYCMGCNQTYVYIITDDKTYVCDTKTLKLVSEFETPFINTTRHHYVFDNDNVYVYNPATKKILKTDNEDLSIVAESSLLSELTLTRTYLIGVGEFLYFFSSKIFCKIKKSNLEIVKTTEVTGSNYPSSSLNGVVFIEEVNRFYIASFGSLLSVDLNNLIAIRVYDIDRSEQMYTSYENIVYIQQDKLRIYSEDLNKHYIHTISTGVTSEISSGGKINNITGNDCKGKFQSADQKNLIAYKNGTYKTIKSDKTFTQDFTALIKTSCVNSDSYFCTVYVSNLSQLFLLKKDVDNDYIYEPIGIYVKREGDE